MLSIHVVESVWSRYRTNGGTEGARVDKRMARSRQSSTRRSPGDQQIITRVERTAKVEGEVATTKTVEEESRVDIRSQAQKSRGAQLSCVGLPGDLELGVMARAENLAERLDSGTEAWQNRGIAA